MGDLSDLRAAAEAALRSGDYGALVPLIHQYATEDFVTEWPQSGERLTRAMAAQMADYPELSGMSPKFTLKRTLEGGDLLVFEGTIDYGDGTPVSYVGIAETRDGKVARMTEYFANPFERPAWREGITELMTPTPA